MLTEEIKSSFKDASNKLAGGKKRAFMAQVTKDYLDWSPRKAETVLGCSREAVLKGLKELKTGIIGADNYQSRGGKKTEENLPSLLEDIDSLWENNISTDPKFKSTLGYTRISAAKIRKVLITEKGYQTKELPCCQTIGDILNPMGYSLKKHKKSNPWKKYRRRIWFLPM